ncbi:Na+/H+ antiporter [Streptomyces harbinensis]|uniref:Na+/H+ antiporter n=1 Tax=Streptomyces harbinensis TaxID=1176198 RepID=UPI00159233FD|nr:Na+/H+ antiporter [Streptomyces harbinensis]QKV67629.1 Na+/H+ antiporter [Streptomyces harbinensis]
MLALVLVVLLGTALVLGHTTARRLRVAPPIVLLLGGLLLGFVPALREVRLPPETVLLLFLPALLFWESLTTSLREIRSNLRPIVLLSTVLVIATAGAVAVVGYLLGLPWGAAWVLGAAVAPTDATAVSVLARALPRRTITTLRAESLVNDGTALVLYGLAVGITVGAEHFTVPHVTALFLLSVAVGALSGVVVAWIGVRVRGLLADPLLGNVALLIIPFTAFLLAEVVHSSGVLAVVVCGLIMSQAGPRVASAEVRRQAIAFWSLATFVLNGSLFVLVGLQAQEAVRELTSAGLARAALAVAAVSAVVIGVRFLFLFTSPYVIRLLDRRPRQRARRVGARTRVVSATAGFRGAVSLAVALSVPRTLDSGAPFPERDLIVCVTCGVIAVTIVVQGLLLPVVVRWARLPPDTGVEAERQLAETLAAEEALAALPEVAAGLGTAREVLERTRREYETHLAVLRAGTGDGDGEDEAALRHDRHYTELRLAMIAHKRATVLRLRDERRIDDTVLRQLQSRLDIEEVRLTRREAAE